MLMNFSLLAQVGSQVGWESEEIKIGGVLKIHLMSLICAIKQFYTNNNLMIIIRVLLRSGILKLT